MEKVETHYTCGCCKHQFSKIEILSAYYHDTTLYGKPIGNELPESLVECPKCHYVSDDIEYINDSTKQIVLSKEYKKLFKPTTISSKYEAALKLYIDQEDIIEILKEYVWVLEDNNEKETAFNIRERLIYELDTYLDYEVNLDYVMICLDSLRINHRFTEANNIIQEFFKELSYKKFLCNDLLDLIDFLKFEQKLVSKKDTDIHYVSEIDSTYIQLQY